MQFDKIFPHQDFALYGICVILQVHNIVQKNTIMYKLYTSMELTPGVAGQQNSLQHHHRQFQSRLK